MRHGALRLTGACSGNILLVSADDCKTYYEDLIAISKAYVIIGKGCASGFDDYLLSINSTVSPESNFGGANEIFFSIAGFCWGGDENASSVEVIAVDVRKS